MEIMLRLQCDDLLDDRIEWEMPTGLATIASAARKIDGFVVRVIDGEKG